MRIREGVEGELYVAGRCGALLFSGGDKLQFGDILVATLHGMINDLTIILIFTLADDAIAVDGRYLIANVETFEEIILVQRPCGQHPRWSAQQVLLLLVVRVDKQVGARSDAWVFRALLLLAEIRVALELNLVDKLHVELLWFRAG